MQKCNIDIVGARVVRISIAFQPDLDVTSASQQIERIDEAASAQTFFVNYRPTKINKTSRASSALEHFNFASSSKVVIQQWPKVNKNAEEKTRNDEKRKCLQVRNVKT